MVNTCRVVLAFVLGARFTFEASAISGQWDCDSQACQSTDGAGLVQRLAPGRDQGKTSSGNPSFVLLLTTYNEPARTEMYAKRIEWWLRETTLPIYIVDSYDRSTPFPAYLRSIRDFQEHHFTQDLRDPLFAHSAPSTAGELLSLRQAFERFGGEWARYDYVMKCTGKYVLPSLASAVAAVPRGSAFVVQSRALRLYPEDHWAPWVRIKCHWFRRCPGQAPWVGTECLGFDAQRMGDLVTEVAAQAPGPLEMKLAALLRRDNDRYPFHIMQRMEIPEAYRTKRGDGSTLAHLAEVDAL